MGAVLVAERDDAALLRERTGLPDLREVVVYDADFPAEAGQRFVSAALVRGDGSRVETDLGADEFRISDTLHEIAALECVTVKFWLELPEDDDGEVGVDD